uniref:Uncharacterized protein n=1 Tax=Rangifer tarandus platyrhynchus TaxID=3082113 RepID=A0ACB0FMM9_RANTA|nr:unnamed protein product [Rangifer tarandus platyrhynchus]
MELKACAALRSRGAEPAGSSATRPEGRGAGQRACAAASARPPVNHTGGWAEGAPREGRPGAAGRDWWGRARRAGCGRCGRAAAAAGRRGREAAHGGVGLSCLRLAGRLSQPNPCAAPGETRGAVGSACLAGGVQCSGSETGRLGRPSWAGTLFNNGCGPSAFVGGARFETAAERAVGFQRAWKYSGAGRTCAPPPPAVCKRAHTAAGTQVRSVRREEDPPGVPEIIQHACHHVHGATDAAAQETVRKALRVLAQSCTDEVVLTLLEVDEQSQRAAEGRLRPNPPSLWALPTPVSLAPRVMGVSLQGSKPRSQPAPSGAGTLPAPCLLPSRPSILKEVTRWGE